MNPSVVPEESERWMIVIEVLGRFWPGLSALIAGSFHLVILPLKMSAMIGPVSFRPLLTPGRLYDTVIAPAATGNWSTGPFIALNCAGLSDGSLPANATVADSRSVWPAPDPTGLKLTVRPLDFSVLAHCW